MSSSTLTFRLEGDIILHLSPDTSCPRLLIPACLRHRCLELLKMLHCHPNKMAARARKSFWWPFMNSDIQKLHRSCQTCVEKAPSNPQDHILTHEPASYPFQFVHFDFGSYAGKQWLIGAEKWMKAMLVYVNTPRRPLNKSPAEILLGREVRDGLPITREHLVPQHQAAVLRRCTAIKEHRLALSKKDRLPELNIGQRVAVQDKTSKRWTDQGEVVAADRKRSYSVKLDSGAVVWRNRRFLKPIPSSTTPTPTTAKPQPPSGPRRSTRQSRPPQRFGQ